MKGAPSPKQQMHQSERSLVKCLSFPDAPLASCQPAPDSRNLIWTGGFFGPPKSSEIGAGRFSRKGSNPRRTLPHYVLPDLPESNRPTPPRTSRRMRRGKNTRESARTESGTKTDRSSHRTGQDPRTGVFEIQATEIILIDDKEWTSCLPHSEYFFQTQALQPCRTLRWTRLMMDSSMLGRGQNERSTSTIATGWRQTQGRTKLKPRDWNQDRRAPEQVPPWLDQEGARERKRASKTAATRRVTQTTSRCKLPPKNRARSQGLEYRTRWADTQKADQRVLAADQVGPRATQP